MEMKKNSKILKKETTALLLIDIQEKILKVIHEYDRVVNNSLKLVCGFKEMKLQIFFTEQYPKGLGETTEVLKTALEGINSFQKITFSCYGAGELFSELKAKKISQIVVCGIESHVCVQQTVLDLLANDFQVVIAADAVSSRRVFDLNIALDRMRANGAEVTSTESILFELLNESGTPEFKAISKLIK